MKRSILWTAGLTVTAVLFCILTMCNDNGTDNGNADDRANAFVGKFNKQSISGDSASGNSTGGGNDTSGGTPSVPNTPNTPSAPSAPSGVSARAASSNSIAVSWSTVTGAASYNVYRSSSAIGSYNKIGTSLSASYTDNSGLTASTTYYYKVSTVNSNGVESSLSSYAYATTNQADTAIVVPPTLGGTGTIQYGDQTYTTVKIGNVTWMKTNLNITTGDSWCRWSSADSCTKYGRLYTWDAAKTACPLISGWRLPDTADYHNVDTTIFKGQSGGLRYPNGNVASGGYWWTATKYDNANAYYRQTGKNDYHGSMDLGLSVRCVTD